MNLTVSKNRKKKKSASCQKTAHNLSELLSTSMLLGTTDRVIESQPLSTPTLNVTTALWVCIWVYFAFKLAAAIWIDEIWGTLELKATLCNFLPLK